MYRNCDESYYPVYSEVSIAIVIMTSIYVFQRIDTVNRADLLTVVYHLLLVPRDLMIVLL